MSGIFYKIFKKSCNLLLSSFLRTITVSHHWTGQAIDKYMVWDTEQVGRIESLWGAKPLTKTSLPLLPDQKSSLDTVAFLFDSFLFAFLQCVHLTSHCTFQFYVAVSEFDNILTYCPLLRTRFTRKENTHPANNLTRLALNTTQLEWSFVCSWMTLLDIKIKWKISRYPSTISQSWKVNHYRFLYNIINIENSNKLKNWILAWCVFHYKFTLKTQESLNEKINRMQF